MVSPDVEDLERRLARERKEVQRDLRQTLLSGVVITVPFLVTVLILAWTLDVLANTLGPLVTVLDALLPFGDLAPVLGEVVAGGLVLALIFFVGLAAQHGPDTRLEQRVDTIVADLPGIGSIYTGVERMSDVLLEGDTESFREVVLVEFPTPASYALAFLTADTEPQIEAAAGVEDMVTVFVPLAPNPVMGGHLVNVPRENVHDVDLSVEEGMQAIMTTGITIDENEREVGGGR